MMSITIRKPSKVRYTKEDYKAQGMFDDIRHEKERRLSPEEQNLINLYNKKEWDTFLSEAVKIGKNIVIAGATGSGKTTYMKSLIDDIPLHERLITIEDTEEITFYEHKNFVQLFYPSEAKSTDPLNSATLLKSCLRMKPDRILLAEVRGAETYDFLNVISSGHNGSMTSCHAGSVKQCLDRLVMMAMQHDQARALGKDMIYQMVKDNIDVIIV